MMGNLLRWNEAQIFAFFFVWIRVSSLLLFVPVFGDKAVPSTVKALLSVAVAWVCFPILWASGTRAETASYQTLLGLALSLGRELLFGALIGFVTRWVFDAANHAGQLAGTAMGLSMASVMDPHTETQTVALAEIKYILALMLFLSADGHHMLIGVINDSFRAVPIGHMAWFAKGDKVITFLADMSAEVIVMSLKLAAPVIAAVFLVNITFGLVSRAVPQMNAFAVSFGASIITGLFITVLCVPAFTNAISGMFGDYAGNLGKFMELFRG